MSAVDLLEKPEKKAKEPSPLSLRTGDMLAQIESASPIAAGSMMRGLGDVERQRAQNERGLAMLQHKQEAEIDTQNEDDTPLSLREWAQRHYGKQLAEYPAKKGVRSVPVKLDKRIREGYGLYFKRHLLRAKSRQAGALSQAKIGTERAQAGSLGRANQPENIAEYIIALMRMGKPIPPQATEMYNATYSKLPGLASKERIATEAVGSKEGIAGRKLGAEVEWRGQGRDAAMDRAQALATSRENIAGISRAGAMDRSVSDRAGRKDIAMLKGAGQKGIIQSDEIVSLGESAADIGKTVKPKEGESFVYSFEKWMAEYMPVARMITPQQRVTLRKALGRHLPSINELHAMILKPQGTPARKGLFVRDTPAVPPSIEEEPVQSRLDMVIEGMRLHGVSEKKIAEYRVEMIGELRGTQPTP